MGAKPASKPTTKIPKFVATPETKLQDPEPYRCLVGKLLNLGFTRPDTTYVTQ